MFKFIEKDEYVEVVIDNSPHNLFDINDLKSLESKIEEYIEKPGLIIYGNSGIFSYGVDYNSIKKLSSSEIESCIRYIKRVFNKIRLFNGYVVSAVEGVALDEGFELALMSDYIIVEPSARIGLSRNRLKNFFSLGGFSRIVERGGEHTFNKILFEGGILSGEYAYQLKIIDFIDENPIWYARDLIGLMIDEYGYEGIHNIKSYMREKYIHQDISLSSIEDQILDRFLLKYDFKKLFEVFNHEI